MPDFVEATCIACLSCETVGERLGEVVSVPHPGGRIPQGDTGCIQQARVGVAEDMPPHPRPVEGAEGGDEGTEGWGVGANYWQVKALKQMYCAVAKGDHAETLCRLWGIDPPSPVPGTADTEDMAVYVAWLERDDLPPTEARQQDELGHGPVYPRHALDDILDVLEAQGVLTGRSLRNPDATGWQR